MTSRSGRTPDYADPAWWSVAPEMDSVAARALAGHEQAGDPVADVFYIHPTTTRVRDWNELAPDDASRSWTDRSATIRQLDPFTGPCRLYAPRYRQAGPRALREPGSEADDAWGLAYRDVRAAFTRFLALTTPGRPFILFGHSQGALHAARLLAEVIEPDGLSQRLVAAYVIGIGVSEGLFGTLYRSLQPCTRPDQIGCVVSWNSFLRDADASTFLARTRLRDAPRIGGRPGRPLCLNPLSFDATCQDVSAIANPGTLTGMAGTLPIGAVLPALVGATADEMGVLRVDLPPPGMGLDPLPGGNMHMHDIALFHAALRKDVARRAGRAVGPVVR